MRLFWIIGLAAAALGVAPAHSQWVYNSSGGEFDGEALHYAFTGADEYGLGVRCKSKSIDIIFMTRDRSFEDESKFSVINFMDPKLKFKIDGGSVREISGRLQNGDLGLAFLGELSLADAVSLRDAKKSVAVIISVVGQNFHEAKFQMRGSTDAIEKVISGCGLE